MSVSRVEYDAALKRVQRRATHRPCSVVEPCGETASCRCVVYTLAALGLDEPPTEPEPFDVRDHPMAFPSHVDEPPTEEDRLSERQYAATLCCGGDPHDCDRYRVCPMLKFQKVVPPAEPPKACPTCEAYREVIEREQIAGLFNQILKPRGSGIDGGTA